LEAEGVNVRLNAGCLDAEKDGDKIRIKLDCDIGDKAVAGSHLLLAVGRIPNPTTIRSIPPRYRAGGF